MTTKKKSTTKSTTRRSTRKTTKSEVKAAEAKAAVVEQKEVKAADTAAETSSTNQAAFEKWWEEVGQQMVADGVSMKALRLKALHASGNADKADRLPDALAAAGNPEKGKKAYTLARVIFEL